MQSWAKEAEETEAMGEVDAMKKAEEVLATVELPDERAGACAGPRAVLIWIAASSQAVASGERADRHRPQRDQHAAARLTSAASAACCRLDVLLTDVSSPANIVWDGRREEVILPGEAKGSVGVRADALQDELRLSAALTTARAAASSRTAEAGAEGTEGDDAGEPRLPLLDVVDVRAVRAAIASALPGASPRPITGSTLMAPSACSLVVRLSFSDVGFVHTLRDAVLSGDFDQAVASSLNAAAAREKTLLEGGAVICADEASALETASQLVAEAAEQSHAFLLLLCGQSPRRLLRLA